MNKYKVRVTQIQINTTKGRQKSCNQALTFINSPPLHSWLFLANHILYEPINAILPRAPFSFWIALIHTWLKMYSRVEAFLWLITPLHPISRGRLRASKPAWMYNVQWMYIWNVLGSAPPSSSCKILQGLAAVFKTKLFKLQSWPQKKLRYQTFFIFTVQRFSLLNLSHRTTTIWIQYWIVFYGMYFFSM